MAAVSHLTAAASLLHNNLASSSNGWVVAIHNSLNAGNGKLLLHALASGQRLAPDAAGTQATTVVKEWMRIETCKQRGATTRRVAHAGG
eukprot:s2677_g6.t1